MKFVITIFCNGCNQSHLAGGGWIEMSWRDGNEHGRTSHLAGGGWIEITNETVALRVSHVPPRRRWVD